MFTVLNNKMILKKYIIFLLLLVYTTISAQEIQTNTFNIKVEVEDKNTGNSIKNAEVFVNEKHFYYDEIDCKPLFCMVFSGYRYFKPCLLWFFTEYC